MSKAAVAEKVQYAWREGTRAKIDAQIAGEVIVRLAGKDESTAAEEIVKAARSPSSPLHPAFVWDDATAAEEFRLLQARNIINAIRMVDPETGALVRVFVHIDSDEIPEPAYMTVSVVMSNPSLRDHALEAALRDLRAWRQRYADLKELAEVFVVVDKL